MSRKVLASFEDEFHSHCVDVFMRPNGSFGFEEFRRETDGGGLWQSLGKYSQFSFATGERALQEAQLQVAWFKNAGPWRW